MAATPGAPVITSPTVSSLTVTVDPNGNPAGTEYAMFESGTGTWVNPVTGTIGAGTAVWAADTGAWNVSGGGVTLAGLQASTAYTLAAKARNSALEETPLGPAAVGTTGSPTPPPPPPSPEPPPAPPTPPPTPPTPSPPTPPTPPPTPPPPAPPTPPPTLPTPPPPTPPTPSTPPTPPQAPSPQPAPAAPIGGAFGQVSVPSGIRAGGGASFGAPVITDIRLLSVSPSVADSSLVNPVLEIHGTAASAARLLVFTLTSTPVTAAFETDFSPWVITWLPPSLSPGVHSITVYGAAADGATSPASSSISFIIPATAMPGESLTGGGAPACANGIDDDNDFLTDYPNDPDCESSFDTSEQGAVVTRAQRIIAPFATATPVVALRALTDNRDVEVVSREAVAPVATTVAAVATAAAAGPSLLLYLQHLFTLPFGLLLRRRREKWGIVYHALTKRPLDLATVRLVDAATNRIVQTRVTDRGGRFLFLVRPGSYRIAVEKAGHVFPSVVLRGAAADGKFAELYHGGAISVTGEGISALAPTIPMDPREVSIPSLAALRARRTLRTFGSFLPTATLLTGAVTLVIVPTWLLLALFAGNLVIYHLMRRLVREPKPTSFGTVSDTAKGMPVQNAVVRLFDAAYHKLLGVQLTDARGRYAFLVGPNVYEVSAEAKAFAPAVKKDIDLRDKETAIVDVPITLSPQGNGPTTTAPSRSAPPAPPAPPTPRVAEMGTDEGPPPSGGVPPQLPNR